MSGRIDISGRRSPVLEATYSPAEVAAAWGVSRKTIFRLIEHGRRARGLDPQHGGLWPVFRPTLQAVRIPAGAMQRHLDHMERLACLGPLPCPTRLRRSA
jgi:hypothetical protein